jgi:DNA-binding NtrC family response regulator
MKASILIVGDDPILQLTRAELLRDWHITTTSSRNAGEAMQSRKYDLLIFSQTVQETQARNLIAQASALHPNARILAIRSGEDRELGSPTYQVDLNNPGGLRSAVARILEYETTPSAC